MINQDKSSRPGHRSVAKLPPRLFGARCRGCLLDDSMSRSNAARCQLVSSCISDIETLMKDQLRSPEQDTCTCGYFTRASSVSRVAPGTSLVGSCSLVKHQSIDTRLAAFCSLSAMEIKLPQQARRERTTTGRRCRRLSTANVECTRYERVKRPSSHRTRHTCRHRHQTLTPSMLLLQRH